MPKPIYLDYNATTPIASEVATAMKPYIEQLFGNPSSNHIYGADTSKAINKARLQVAKLLNCIPEEIVFTSGGTESNNFAIKGVAFANKHKGKHIISSVAEHPAVLEVCKFLETQGFEITYLPVDNTGRVSLASVQQALRSDTILLSIMLANNEIGTLSEISEISKLVAGTNCVLHTDASQAVGKIPVNVQALGIGLLSVAGHKLYAPKGVGALYIRGGIVLEKMMHGANHERNLRAGTENVLEIVGLGAAAQLATQQMHEQMQHNTQKRNLLYNLLAEKTKDIRRNGHPSDCLPNTLSVSFADVQADELLANMPQLAASAGSACHAEGVNLSHVLAAIALPSQYAAGTIRLSVGRYTTDEEIHQAADLITIAIAKIRAKL